MVMTPRTAVEARRRVHALAAARLVALGGVVFGVWAWVFDKWTPAAFARPIAYVIDGMFTLGLVKAGADLDFVPFLSKANSHYAADWNDFPLSDDHLFFFWGQVSRFVGPIAALNLAYLSCAVGAAFSLYLVGRWLRLRWEACFVAGALYGLAPFLFYRSLHHFTLVNYWHVPLLVPLAVWLGGHRALELRSRRFRLAVGIAVLAGIYNVYYLNYALQILGLCVLSQVLRRRWRHARMGALVIAAALAAFLATNLDTLAARWKRGPNPTAIQRGAADVGIYALRPFELFVPGPRHRLDVFAAAAERHRGSTIAVGEFPSMYLGVVGGVGFLWLMAVSLGAALLGRRPGWGRFGLVCAWLIFIAMDGGGMQFFQALTGQVLFRSNNRVSIFLLMFALLFLARLLTALSRKTPRGLLPALAVVLLAVGAFDQTPSMRVNPNFPHWETVSQREQVARADERLVTEFERRVPVGTMVFQLPAMQFPESGFLGRVPDYDQLRPYLFSKALHFSYGNMKGRPEAQWQNRIAALSAAELVAELERLGFGGLYVLRQAYAPQQVEALLEALRGLGRTEILESEYGDSLFVVLHPAATPAALPR
jgi:phosphoglycerol transferase